MPIIARAYTSHARSVSNDCPFPGCQEAFRHAMTWRVRRTRRPASERAPAMLPVRRLGGKRVHGEARWRVGVLPLAERLHKAVEKQKARIAAGLAVLGSPIRPH
jgi:hypothetical protein